MPKRQLNATITKRIDCSADLALWRVRYSGEAAPEPFVPGQYVSLGVSRGEPEGDGPVDLVVRPYSIASSSHLPHEVELLIRLVDGGALTTKLWACREGEPVWLHAKKRGTFTLEQAPEKGTLVWVATGTGIAPYISMLRTFAEEPPWQMVHLVWGVSYKRDLVYHDELVGLCRRHPHVRYTVAVSRQPPPSNAEVTGVSCLRGRVTQILDPEVLVRILEGPLRIERTAVYLCGNPAMIAHMRAGLESMHFVPHSKTHPGNLFVEEYW